MVTIDSCHSHEIETAHMLSFRTPHPETKAAFEAYFEDGMTAGGAIAYHDSMFDLAVVQSSPSQQQTDRAAEMRIQIDRADGSKNPRRRAVYHLHSKCRTKTLGKCLDVFCSEICYLFAFLN